MSVNRVILVGRLGKDPELKYTPSGSPVCTLTVATSESWTDKSSGQKQEKTEWHRVVLWGRQAENCNKFLKKGSLVYLEGKIQTRSWEDKDGNKKYSTEINANTVNFLSKSSGSSYDNEESPNEDISTHDDYANDDIPF